MAARYWSIVIIYVLMQLSGIVAVPALLAVGSFDSAQQASYFWIFASFIVALIVILILLIPERGQRLAFNKPKMPWPNSVAWIFIGFALAYAGQIVAGLIEQNLLGIDTASENTAQIIELVNSMPAFVIIVAVIGPILEELVFRKAIFGSLYKRTNFFIAAIISSLIFAAVHLDFTHLLVYTMIGFVFAYLYVKTGRIIVPIIVHSLMNAFVVGIQVLFQDEIERIMREAESALILLVQGLM
ncbi:hypothetical protein SAMN05421781_3026 [Marinococcus luteus]|uniref:CAAX prenyl protease 2/Lysostaphin resistance protein A-like domain-containing protein n=1 Tax=Marinococcus luteus TaxID=1122204 RepID=A0A1H2Y668_9BACI|nr:type II CAAX endopeptidase family protein [Marinococcus luteus]SDX00692.1 hypothetical protein SAMN05421781_3026 [Marinococcus luteus]